MSTSQNGWPVLDTRSSLLHSWVVPTLPKPVTLTLHQGSVGFVLAHFALVFDDSIQDLNGPVLDDYGYAYRPVRGYDSVWSDHSSGTAIDLNATSHPLGKEGTFTAVLEERIHHVLAKRYDGLIAWGGDYHNRKDEMHYELAFGSTMAQVEALAKKLVPTNRGQLLLGANPGQKAVIFS